jgi:hypothetical protein
MVRHPFSAGWANQTDHQKPVHDYLAAARHDRKTAIPAQPRLHIAAESRARSLVRPAGNRNGSGPARKDRRARSASGLDDLQDVAAGVTEKERRESWRRQPENLPSTSTPASRKAAWPASASPLDRLITVPIPGCPNIPPRGWASASTVVAPAGATSIHRPLPGAGASVRCSIPRARR